MQKQGVGVKIRNGTGGKSTTKLKHYYMPTQATQTAAQKAYKLPHLIKLSGLCGVSAEVASLMTSIQCAKVLACMWQGSYFNQIGRAHV